MTRPLTSLQQAVIDRLRSLGHIALADEAHEVWTRGDRLMDYQVGHSVGDSRLAEEFARANTAAAETQQRTSEAQ